MEDTMIIFSYEEGRVQFTFLLKKENPGTHRPRYQNLQGEKDEQENR